MKKLYLIVAGLLISAGAMAEVGSPVYRPAGVGQDVQFKSTSTVRFDADHSLRYDPNTNTLYVDNINFNVNGTTQSTAVGGGASALEVFNADDGTRSSPTSSISLSDAFRGLVTGTTYQFRINPSSVATVENTLTKSSASATYFLITSSVAFLTTSSATATYLTQSSASVTYLLQTASTAFISASSVTATYLAISSATATYLNKLVPYISSINVSSPLVITGNGLPGSTPSLSILAISMSTGIVGQLQQANLSPSVTFYVQVGAPSVQSGYFSMSSGSVTTFYTNGTTNLGLGASTSYGYGIMISIGAGGQTTISNGTPVITISSNTSTIDLAASTVTINGHLVGITVSTNSTNPIVYSTGIIFSNGLNTTVMVSTSNGMATVQYNASTSAIAFAGLDVEGAYSNSILEPMATFYNTIAFPSVVSHKYIVQNGISLPTPHYFYSNVDGFRIANESASDYFGFDTTNNILDFMQTKDSIIRFQQDNHYTIRYGTAAHNLTINVPVVHTSSVDIQGPIAIGGVHLASGAYVRGQGANVTPISSFTGLILQCATGTAISASSTTASTAFVNSGINTTMTPLRADSLMIVVACFSSLNNNQNGGNGYATIKNTTSGLFLSQGTGQAMYEVGIGALTTPVGGGCMVGIDRPRSVSSQNYAIFFRGDSGTTGIGSTVSSSYVDIFEIGGPL